MKLEGWNPLHEIDARVLHLEPGDVIVIRPRGRRITVAQAEQIREQALAYFAGHDVVVLPPELDIEAGPVTERDDPDPGAEKVAW